MQFNVHHYSDEPAAEIPGVEFWTWRLVKTGGEVVCQGPMTFDSVKACRSQIAEAKKAMRGAGRCKVVEVE